MSRVICYIDGFNLYFGLKSKGWRKYYWLDLVALSKTVLKPGQNLVASHYFTARIRTDGRNAADAKRQSTYLDALATLPELTIHFGHYLDKLQRCNRCGATWTYYEEKMTDVNIASQLLCDAHDNEFDTAIIVSADSDLTTPVTMVRNRLPEKRIIVALPPNRRSHQLTKAANGYFVINETAFRRNQLPENVETAKGFVLERPRTWN